MEDLTFLAQLRYLIERHAEGLHVVAYQFGYTEQFARLLQDTLRIVYCENSPPVI